MKAFLGLLLIAALAVGGWLGYQRFLAPVEKRACGSIAGRCNLDDGERDACEKLVKEVAKSSGDDSASKFAGCLAESKSCIEAAGCATGLGTSILSKNALEFAAGLRRAL